MPTTRREFLTVSTLGLTGVAVAPALGAGGSERADDVAGTFPTTPPELARAIVGASHGNLERVEELLREDRSLALARIDWGYGDWETALGAASHVGRPEIAELLMGHGARVNLFTLAMLDRVDAVRAVCEAMPGVQRTRGPHGISLMRHARAGEASRVIEYLEGLGGADESEPGTVEPFEGQAGFHGVYAGDGLEIEIGDHRRGWLCVKRPGSGAHVLRRRSEWAFSPSGAPHVRFEFEAGSDGGIGALSVSGGSASVRAVRVEG